MMQQYFQAKEEHPGVIMAMRVGDFYEFYGEDAEIAAEKLQITLTGREDGGNGRISMAGVPFFAIEKYLAKLVSLGLKVALCDQVEDPKTAKGLVRRAVTRVLTPGTIMEESMLSGASNNFLVGISVTENQIAIATLDPSTGEFLVTETDRSLGIEILLSELARLKPSEVLIPNSENETAETIRNTFGLHVSEVDSPDFRRSEQALLDQFHTTRLSGFGMEDKPASVLAASMVLVYANKNGLSLDHVDSISTYALDEFMAIDLHTRRALELTQNLRDNTRKFTLLGSIDETVTPMGARLLRRWIEQPLVDKTKITNRHDSVEKLVQMGLARLDLREGFKRIGDIERLVGRCAAKLATPRDLSSLKSTLESISPMAIPLAKIDAGRILELTKLVDPNLELCEFLGGAIVVDPPLSMREGGVIANGFNAELDQLRALAKDGRKFIAKLEQEERDLTGINSLKVGYNSVFGYFIEIGKVHSDKVPAHYVRKQTTANAERYITAGLKEQEAAVLGASDKSQILETELFNHVRSRVNEFSHTLLQTARAISEIDVLMSYAEASVKYNFRRPEIVDEDILEITGGRHPVVELNHGNFVPNDLAFHEKAHRLMVLTGPNMSGKSTYLRQAAIIILLAQIGCFVPAKKCRLGLCDRIFARIGARDEIALGQSTFMVEMVESAYILHHAHRRSLVIFDEVGRGTSTYDGLAIAWSMIEYLAEIGCKTIFATHYHQINSLAESDPGIVNYRMAVREMGEEVIWTHKVLPGGTDRSYGIQVAQKAGLPRTVLKRAKEVLSELEQNQSAPVKIQKSSLQLTLFEAEDPWIFKTLRELDVNELTPIQAMQLIDEWKRQIPSKE